MDEKIARQVTAQGVDAGEAVEARVLVMQPNKHKNQMVGEVWQAAFFEQSCRCVYPIIGCAV